MTGAVVGTALRGYLQDRVDDRLVLTGQIAARLSPPADDDTPPVIRALGLFGAATVTHLDDGDTVRRAFEASTELPGGGPDLPELDRAAVQAHGAAPSPSAPATASTTGACRWTCAPWPPTPCTTYAPSTPTGP
ncbi:hypothetical protein RKD49_000733 [Streptomyces glaucescens]